MSDVTDEETPAPEPVKVKQVAVATGMVTAALTAAVAFTVAGPLGVGIAAAGVAGTGYTVHRIRNPRNGTLLQSLLTRPRRPTKTGGTLTWPFTGNQQRRALTRSGRASGPSSRSKLPSLTSTRARRSAALTGRSTGAAKRGIGTSRSARSLPTTSNGRTRTKPVAGGRPTRSLTPPRKPLTPSRTPAKLSGSRVGSLARKRSGAGSGVSWPKSKRSPSGRTGSNASRRTPVTTSTGRTRPRTVSWSLRKKAGFGVPGLSTPGRSSTRSRRAGKWRNPFQSTRGGRSLGGRSTGSNRTHRAKRLGATVPTRPQVRRWSRDRNRDTVPNRTRLRPRPYRRSTTGQLLRTGLRLPVRRRSTPGSRRVIAPWRLPSKRQSKRARRTLRLRSGVYLRHGVRWLATTPARSWDRFWSKLPKAPTPLTYHTQPVGMKTPAGPKHPNQAPKPAPSPLAPAIVRDINLMPINQNGNVIYVSDPNQTIVEAFQQLTAFHPTGAVEVETWLAQHPETLQQVGAAYGALADRMRDQMPFAAPVADAVREIGVALAAAGGIAQQAHQTMRAAHTADFQRFEEPRPDEGMWNPENNR